MKKKFALIATLVCVAGIIVGCDSNSSTGSNNFSYNYLLCENCSDGNGGCYANQSQCAGGCTTGNQSFTDQTDACNALNSASQNNDCQSDQRQQMFQELGCSGTFTNS